MRRNQKNLINVKKEPLAKIPFKGISNYKSIQNLKVHEDLNELDRSLSPKMKKHSSYQILGKKQIESRISEIKPYKSKVRNLRYFTEIKDEPDKYSDEILDEHLPEIKYKIVKLKNEAKLIVDLKNRAYKDIFKPT